MRISDWSSDVCSSDLRVDRRDIGAGLDLGHPQQELAALVIDVVGAQDLRLAGDGDAVGGCQHLADPVEHGVTLAGHREAGVVGCGRGGRSEEHTSELQSLMRISYAVFCLITKNQQQDYQRLT